MTNNNKAFSSKSDQVVPIVDPRRRSSLATLVKSQRRSSLARRRRGSSQQDHRRESLTKEEAADIQYILSQLSEDELETAARTSYGYLVSLSSKENAAPRRQECAARMAKRYLRSKKDADKALERMRATCAFRKKMDVDGLRTAFDNKAASDDKEEKRLEYQKRLGQGLASQHVHVRGYDQQGRSTYIFEPARVTGHDAEWTLKEHVYTLERAIACSRHKDDQVNAVVNFSDFRVHQHAPPHHIGVDFMTTLRHHYVGHVHKIFLVDAPMAFSVLWNVFKPFVGRATRDKIVFVSSQQQKQKHFGVLYDDNQAASWMLPTGSHNRPLHVSEYLERQPFVRAFDE